MRGEIRNVPRMVSALRYPSLLSALRLPLRLPLLVFRQTGSACHKNCHPEQSVRSYDFAIRILCESRGRAVEGSAVHHKSPKPFPAYEPQVQDDNSVGRCPGDMLPLPANRRSFASLRMTIQD